MSALNKIPRGWKVLIVMVVIAILVWKFAIGSYFYPGIAVAIILTLLVIYFVYKPTRDTAISGMSKNKKQKANDSKTKNIEPLTDKPNADNINNIQYEDSSEPPMPLIDDETSLTIEEKNQVVNAVWYRCENPYCKYTRFLGVHHIIEEKAGGTNKLDNLIVLCPYCHDLAHRNEIPENEMRDWISNREDRFKLKPEWPYK
jgi:hypothetical protein